MLGVYVADNTGNPALLVISGLSAVGKVKKNLDG